MNSRLSLVKSIILLQVIFWSIFKVNCGCTCLNSKCEKGCTKSLEDKPCNHTLYCLDNTEYIRLDNDVGLLYRKNPSTKEVNTDFAKDACSKYSKFFGEISNQAYYGYVSDLIVSLFSERRYRYPAYIRLNIAINMTNKSPYFETLKNISYPDLKDFQNKKDFKDNSDTFKSGLKIELDRSQNKKLSIGYYDEVFNGVLCLSSNNLTTNTSSCIDEKIIETCSITYLVNNTNITKYFDCYELEKINYAEDIRVEIENKKSEELQKIESQTTKEIQKLKEKYKLADTFKYSFGILAYVIIGLFIFVISIGDCVRLVKYFMNKLRNDKKSLVKNSFENFQRKKVTKDDNKPIDYNKIRQFDDRFLEMQMKFVKSNKSSSK